MKKDSFLKRLTLIDYVIIIIIIAAVIFAFIHITSDDTSESEKTSFDSSTLNKIVERYLNYYRQGLVVNTTVEGFNSTNGQPVTLHGTIVWMDDDKGSNVKVLIESNGTTYLAGLYNHVPQADIYINSITLETDGQRYNNLTEITLKPEDINSLNDLISGLPNSTNYEISATIALESLDSTHVQEINNQLYNSTGRIAIKGSNTGLYNQISLVRATSDEIHIADSILGSFNGRTGEITIRIYNCSDNDIELIKNNFDVSNIQRF